jgi:hypothetical protein
MKYREQRSSLEESMQTEMEVTDKQQLLDHLNQQWNGRVTDISFQYCTYDQRIQWDTWYVIAMIEGYDQPMIVGMSNDKFD